MKRRIFRLIWAAAAAAILTVPASAAKMLIPVGRVVGLSVEEGTVTVAQFDRELGASAKAAGVQIGDEILTADGAEIDSAEDLRRALEHSDGSVELQVRRKDRRLQMNIHPRTTPDGPRLGIYLREGVTGIGTVTYFDPQTADFGALGHGVSDSHGKICIMETGTVYEAEVVGIRRGQPGNPGQLRGYVAAAAPIAPLEKNTAWGIFGQGGAFRGEALPVAAPEEVELGPAQILSNIEGDQVERFEVEIRRRNFSPGSNGRDLLLEVTDPRLLEATGGIVAGMSGSPILQNGRLVGAVTHVLVNDPTKGFGILIENMLEAAG